MRGASACCRWLLVLASAGMVFATVDSCTANLMRDVADSLDQTANDIDGQPPTFGQWLDDVFASDDDRKDDPDDDWWDDLWD